MMNAAGEGKGEDKFAFTTLTSNPLPPEEGEEVCWERRRAP